MALKYNPKTGDFENVAEKKPTVQPSPRQTKSSTGSSFLETAGGCLNAIVMLALQLVPYLLLGALISMCS